MNFTSSTRVFVLGETTTTTTTRCCFYVCIMARVYAPLVRSCVCTGARARIRTRARVVRAAHTRAFIRLTPRATRALARARAR